MGVFYDHIPPSLHAWILDQKMLWVATAPLSPTGHINISPKGGPYFGIANENSFWFMDLTGSGVETTAHVYENGRLCVMFMAFEGAPRIVRLWGKGTVHETGTPSFTNLVTTHNITPLVHTRSIITLDVTQAGSSCGFSVPFYSFNGYRPTLNNHFDKRAAAYENGKKSESMDLYWAFKSQYSVDGLPGMKRAVEVAKLEGVKPLKKMVGKEGEVVERRIRQMAGGGHWAGLKKRREITGVELLGVVLLSFLMGVLGVVTMVSPDTVRAVPELGMVRY